MTDLGKEGKYIPIEELCGSVRSLSLRILPIRCVFKKSKFKEKKKTLKKLMTDLSNKFYKLAQQLEYNKNFDTAIELYQKSVELGNTDAMVALANIYIEEKKSEKYNEAVQLLKIAIAKGSIDAKNILARCYFNDIDGILLEDLEEEATKLFKEFANLGDMQAICRLLLIYSEKNKEKLDLMREKVKKEMKKEKIDKNKLFSIINMFVLLSDSKEEKQKYTELLRIVNFFKKAESTQQRLI